MSNIQCPPASAKLSKPNARWRDGFSLVPSIRVGFADKRKVGWIIKVKSKNQGYEWGNAKICALFVGKAD
jgi:hypothetical protein